MCAAPADGLEAGTTAATGWRDGQLVSTRFNDVYFSRSGGLDESRAVFLEGCGLPQAWAGRQRFTVAELGFGTGLNMLALLDLWASHRPPGATLHLFSIEAHPLPRAVAAKAHQAIDGLNRTLAAALLDRWPQGARGLHRLYFPAIGATLDLMIADAATAVTQWTGKADAWFLDGFAPARNPSMWTDKLLEAVAARTAEGGRAATYTVAGHVRRGLAAAGFQVERLPGFGSKRQRLEARLPGAVSTPPSPRVAIIGAGIAGASLARAFSALDLEATVFAQGPMASANPAALVTPRLAAASSDAAALHAACFRHAVRCYAEMPGAVIANGVTRLLTRDDDLPRARASIESGLFEPGSMQISGGKLAFSHALVVDPAVIRSAWLPAVQPRAVAQITRQFTGARQQMHLHDTKGDVVAEADVVIIAAGMASALLGKVQIRPVRGQVSVSATAPEMPATSWGGYVAPTRHGLIIGATHDRSDSNWDVREADNDRNRAMLAERFPELAARLGPLQGIAGVRAATFHNQPVAGRLRNGVFALTGLGGHGFALAPLLAEHLAARISGVVSPLPAPLARLLGS